MNIITPYEGYADFTFNMTYEEVKGLLKVQNNLANVEIWPNKGCDPEVPWQILRTKDDVSFFFAKGKLFKMYFMGNFQGSLSNGICLGMTLQAAEEIDTTLRYDDWEEDYLSDSGYWLEDNPENGEIISITIFIKELENDDVFFSYEWCNSHCR